MSILSTNSRLIKVGQDYSAGSGISIDDKVISVTGEFGKTYSAGDNISIYEQNEQLYISSKDWTNDIANASANALNEAISQIPDPFDPSFISGQVDNKLDTTSFTNWQNGQYSTDLQTIEGQISNKLDKSEFSQVSSTFLTAINIPESAVWQDVSTTVQSNSAQWADSGSGDEEVNSFVYNNSAKINDVNSSYQTNSGSFLTAAPSDMATTGDVAELAQTVSETYQVKGDYLVHSDSANFYPMDGNPSGFLTAHQSLDGYATTAWVNEQGYLTGVSIPVSSTWNEVSTTVQINSAQWADVGAISSYTMTLSPYGDGVINTLNEKYISAFLSQSADKSNFANNANSANSANYAETVNETYLENKGFARNLTSEYGTVSIVNNNIIESTNSAVVRTISNEGFVSSYDGQTLGPAGNGIATYRWDKSLPNTIISLDIPGSKNEILTYSANTNLTGEIALPAGGNTQTINIPNATEFKVWANNWVYVYKIVVSAADQFENVVGELAWTSALPTYEYDGTNKISAINGSALAGGGSTVTSADVLPQGPTGTGNTYVLCWNDYNGLYWDIK